MKNRAITSFATLFIIFIFACKKNNGTISNNTSSPRASRITRIQSFASGLTSTVFSLNYDAAGNIASINDSANNVTYLASYNDTGNLVRIMMMFESRAIDSVFYSYDAGGIMKTRTTGEDVNTYFYSSGSLVADTLFNTSGGIDENASTVYRVSGGDIGFEKHVNAFQPIDSITFTYNTAPNPFKQLSLFNWSGGMQNPDFASPYIYFNQHALSGYADSANTYNRMEKATYTYNAANQITEAKSVEYWGSETLYVYDWIISYQ